MTILLWYLLPTLIGWLCFPITYRLFNHCQGRGYAFSRGLGLLLWGYLTWLIGSTGLVQNGLRLQVVVLIFLICFSAGLAYRLRFKNLFNWFLENWRSVLSIEVVFLFAFALLVVLRSNSPAIIATEKPMELAFLNATRRAESFPPSDPWLSGHQISYYYFGYLLAALVANLTGTVSAVAFNLSQALWFGLTAAGSYGLLLELLQSYSLTRIEKDGGRRPFKRAAWLAVIAPILLLLVGNLFGFLDVLHARGLFWQEGSGLPLISRFWSFLDLTRLSEPPTLPFQWQPEAPGGVAWWGASRVIRDFRFDLSPVEIIDEFPAFSYLLGDLHPHLLSMPFVLLVIALALNYLLQSDSFVFTVGSVKLTFHPARFLIDSLLIGSLAFLNLWDWPIYGSLYAAVIFLKRRNWGTSFFRGFLAFLGGGVGLALLGYLFYFPFFSHFSSSVAGVLPAVIFFTRGVYFWIMFAPFLLILMTFLVWSLPRQTAIRGVLLKVAVGFLVLGLTLTLFNAATAWFGSQLPQLGGLFMQNQGAADNSVQALLLESLHRRLMQPGTWLTAGLLWVFSLGLILLGTGKKPPAGKHLASAKIFVGLMILWGTFLVVMPEFVYILDYFGTRMNTIFKFYYQAWSLWATASAFGLCWLWQKTVWFKRRRFLWSGLIGLMLLLIVLTGVPNRFTRASDSLRWASFGAYPLDWAWAGWLLLMSVVFLRLIFKQRWPDLVFLMLIVSIGLGSFYLASAVPNRTQFANPSGKVTLDGYAFYRQLHPEMMTAVDWLWSAPPGVIAEAVDPQGGSYSAYARISTLTGLPTVLGWASHEMQWRGDALDLDLRQEDVRRLYETSDWETAKSIIDKYNIQYIYIGDLERSTYHLNDDTLAENLTLIFQSGDALIFRTQLDE